jgi:nucleoside-diphosphate-sugar epimerase
MHPEFIETEEALDELLTRPRPVLVEFVKTVSSPVLILGAGGKMGPSLAVLARRAADLAGHPLEIVAASRFSDGEKRRWLEERGVRTLSCDLLDPASWQTLPEARDVIYLLGQKFGTTNNPALTWAVNCLPPAYACSRYPTSRVVALSSGSIYPFTSVKTFTPVKAGGALETEPLTPFGEYANACVARERLFEYFSFQTGVSLALLRLFYAVDLRYGVLVDLALKVYAGEPVDLEMGYLNWIWQGDANEMILRSLALAQSPPQAYNLTGLRCESVRMITSKFSELFDRPVCFTGQESETALLGSPALLCGHLGEPPTPLEPVMRWIAHWVQNQGRLLGKPTHFEVRDGRY